MRLETELLENGTERTVIHYEYVPAGLTENRVACGCLMVLSSVIVQKSNDPLAVTCYHCRQSEAYRSAMAERATVPPRRAR